MNTEKMYTLKDKLMRELEEMSSKEMTASNLNMVDTLAHATKNLCKVIDGAEEEYSGDGDWRAYGSYGRSYRGGMNGGSYNSERYSNRHRDSMGRYARDGGRDAMLRNLEEMLEDANTQSERMAIQNCIDQLRK